MNINKHSVWSCKTHNHYTILIYTITELSFFWIITFRIWSRRHIGFFLPAL